MTSPLTPTITLAVQPENLYVVPVEKLLGRPFIKKVVFYLQNLGPDKTRGFYECSEDGCAGCGCPSFAIDESLTIPAWVIDYLRWHVRSRHSCVAAKY